MDPFNDFSKPSGRVKSISHEESEKGADLLFTPGYTVTSTTDGGGALLTDVEVIICYWGSFWSTNPAPSPSSDTYTQAIKGILSGPYLNGLNQYRGVNQGTVIYTDINDSSNPANPYSDTDVVNMLTDRIQNHGMPAPINGHNRFYFVVPPQGVINTLSGDAGQHQSFLINGVRGFYAWTWNTGSLTGHNCVTKVFSHELVEALTDPTVDVSANGILVNGTAADGTAINNDEIGDTCNEQYATVNMNGIQCSVQSYWSKEDNACVLPLGTIEFSANKNRFGKDEVKDRINASGGFYYKAFWINIKGFSKNSFQALGVNIPSLSGSFMGLPGVHVTQNPDIFFTNTLHPEAQQIISIPYDIQFTQDALDHNDFPSSGVISETINAVLNVSGTNVQNSDISFDLYLVAGADPYFNNIDPTADNVYYLSQDLRVFTATPGLNTIPVAGATRL